MVEHTSSYTRPPHVLSEPSDNQELIEMRATDPLIPPAQPCDNTEDRGLPASGLDKGQEWWLYWNLGFSFFLFGLINNVLYVIILSAALDLVPPSTPKGIILFCNIAPSLVAKLAWPYLLKGQIRYKTRLIGCCLLSSLGMVVVAAFDSLSMRLLGISLASFSSGLGELTFLQLSTTYTPASVAGHSVGYFSSGTGAAGLVGAFMWWEVRSLGVRLGVGLSSVMPFIIPAAFSFLLPPRSAFLPFTEFGYDDGQNAHAPPAFEYVPIPATERHSDNDDEEAVPREKNVSLSVADKWRLVKPLLTRYMVPLFCVYTFEYTINQGISPTLLYPVPTPGEHPVLSKIIHSIRDYYPLWQLVYQTTVFFSRSWISIGLPVLPARLLYIPVVIQAIILITLTFESAVGIFSDEWNGTSIVFVFLMISAEGICGGLAYVNAFYCVNQEEPEPGQGAERAKQEKEFKIGSIGFADSSGILMASLLAMPTELELCKAQVRRGKLLCKGL